MILKLRSILFWGHLACGMVAGLFILIMTVTGISIAYQPQIMAWAEHDQRFITTSARTAPLNIEALIGKVQTARPQTIFFTCVIFSDHAASVRFLTAGSGKPVFVNPYTGEIVGDGDTIAGKFLTFMTSLHRWLAMEGPYKSYGKAVTGTVVIIYFAMVLSGLILWLPKSFPWSRSRLRQGSIPSLKIEGKARDWNWHNVAGLWFAPLILISTVTGTIIAHPWAEDIFLRMTGSPVPERRPPSKISTAPVPAISPPKIDTTGFNALWPVAEKQVAHWNSINIQFGKTGQPTVAFMINRGSFGRPDLVDRLTLDRSTGAITNWQPYRNQNSGARLKAWIEPLHTGQAGGWLGQGVAGITALAGVLLIYTGFSLACRRFFGKNLPTRKSPGPY